MRGVRVISPPLRMRFWRYVFHLPFMDRMLRRRAADLLDKAFRRDKSNPDASQLLLDIFGEAGKHTRCALGAAELPLNAPVELDLVVEVK